MREIKALTSIRGVAALWVFLMHLAYDIPHSLTWIDGRFLARGHLAVDLFFVLSGFVMALTYRASFLSAPLSTAYSSFLLRRVARVIPLHAVIVLAVAAGAVILGPMGSALTAAQSPAVVFQNLLLVQTWVQHPSLDPPAWSVSVEMAAYVAFPLLIWLAWNRLAVAAAVSAVIGLALICAQGHGDIQHSAWYGPLLRGFAGFYLGLLTYRLRARMIGALDVALLAALVIVTIYSASDFWTIAICPFLIAALAKETGLFARILALRPLHWLGEVSYSLYLNHFLMIWGAQQLPIASPAIRGALAILATLIGSHITYRLIEHRARRAIVSLAGRAQAALRDAVPG